MTDRPTPTVHLILGASGGIGSALARRLTGSGARVVLAARGRGRLEALATEIGNGAELVTVDATDVDAVADVVAETVARHGRLDGIASCVGSLLLKAAHQTSRNEWRQTLDQNLTTAFAVVRAAGRSMKRGGSVVLLSSAAARIGLANHEAIAAAKAGVIGLALAAAATYAGRGLRFNVVAPGLVDTPLAAAITGNALVRKASEAIHPLGRIGRPEDVASAVAWLLDPANDWVTGQVMGVDGGLGSVRPRASS